MSAEAVMSKINISDEAAHELAKFNWFGAGPGQVYAGWTGPNFRKSLERFVDLSKLWNDRFQKAFTTTVGQYLIPTYLDPGLIDLTRQETPFVALLRRSTAVGLTVNIQQISDIASAQWLAESATLTEQDDTFARKTYNIKYGYAIGKVTGQMRAAGRTYVNALQEAIRLKGIALRRLEEKTALVGTTASSPGDPLTQYAQGYEGIFSIVRSYNSGSNENDLAGSASIQLTDVRDAIETAVSSNGQPNLIVCDLATYYDLKSQIADFERHVNQTEIAWGMTSYTIDGIPVVPSKMLPTTSGQRCLAVLDMNVLEMRVLQDVTYEPLAKTDDADKFMLKVYEVFADASGGKFHATIVGGT